MTDKAMNLEAFRASKRRTETICADLLIDDGEAERGGFIYDAAKVQCYIEDSFAPDRGKYYLLIERSNWISDDLEKLERILWAMHYAYEAGANLNIGDGTLDDFVNGYCDARGYRVDGDVFAQVFSGADDYTPHDAADRIEMGAETWGLKPTATPAA